MNHSGVLFGWLVAAVTIICTGLVFAVIGDDDAVAMQLAAFFCTTMGVMLIVADYRVEHNAASPLLLSMVLLLLHFPFHAMAYSESLTVISLLGAERHEYLTYSVIVCMFAMIATYIGFRRMSVGPITRMISRFDLNVDVNSRVTQGKILILIMIALIAKGVLISNRGFFFIAQTDDTPTLPGAYVFHLLASLFQWIALFFLVSGLSHRVRSRTLLGVGMIIVEAAFGLFVTGSRYQFALPLFAALLAMGIGYRRLKMSTVVGLLAAAFLILIPVASAYKKAYFSQTEEIQRDGFSIGLVTNALDKADDDDGTESWDELVALRFHAATSLAVIIRFMPERASYQLGLPYLMLPVDLLVPRFIWPDKPSIRAFAAEFPKVFWNHERSSRTSVKPSMFGELWSNLHFFGVLLGAYLFGRLLRFLYSGFRLGGSDPIWGIAAAATILPSLILSSIEDELVTALAVTMKSIIIWLIVIRFLGSGGTARARVGTPLGPAPRRP